MMKKTLSLLSLAVLAVGLLGSCSKINERIDSLEKRIDDIENTQIASVEQQITAINTSINELKAADVTINGKIDELKQASDAQQALIDALKEADQALGQKDAALEARIATLESQVKTINGQIETLVNADIAINTRIDQLKSYVDTEIGKAKDWATATFASLTEYQKTADDLAVLSVTVTGISTTLAGVQTSISGLDTKIDGIDADLQGKITSAKTELEGKIADLKTELEGKIATAITASETSIKSWINELMKDYYTAAQVDAKIGALNTAIEASKSTAKERIDSVAKELTALKTAVDTAKAAIRTEYKNAIDVAINKLDGEIRGALKDSILAVNGRIEALDTRVTALEGRIQAVEGKVDEILAMIQSVSITPAYSDGSVEAVDGILTLKCIVSPAAAVVGMASLKDSLLIYADLVQVKTKAASAYMEIKVSEATVTDAKQGAITLKADISEYLPEGEDKALTVAVNVKNGISDFTTGFVNVAHFKSVFKAVFDSNDGSLTFFFDRIDHSGDGIYVYEGNDLFDDAKLGDAKWGYYINRSKVLNVNIDASVAKYSSLTSTAYMFYGMEYANSISGAEYLDVANVTDMSNMFGSFGYQLTSLNAVPDVSGWKTENVTNMSSMFYRYGCSSTSLNAVPDVSGWKTENVTNMSSMFGYYGYSSTSLTAVPDVSGWKTDKVTNMSSMFYYYGHASSNIECELDLTGWNLATLNNRAVNFFNFSPKTFKVTIPAKTGESNNLVNKWFGSSASAYIEPPTGQSFTLASN